MKVAVIDVSPPEIYNLGAEKIANYHKSRGDVVIRSSAYDFFCLNAQKVYLSAIFTKDVPRLTNYAGIALERLSDVEMGGPAVTLLSDWIEHKCGIKPHVGLDSRFDKQSGQYEWTFSSRGCPRNCPFCLVSKLEGKTVVEDDDFIPAPNLADNNIIMTSERHQRRVVDAEKRFSKVDVNSGFDCRVFSHDPKFYFDLWNQLPLVMWRLAFDSAESEPHIHKSLKFFQDQGLDRHKVQVYILCNFPGVSPAEVKDRADIVKGYGMMPYLMRYGPVDRVISHYVAPGWTEETIESLRGYYNFPNVWMSCTWKEYKRSEAICSTRL